MKKVNLWFPMIPDKWGLGCRIGSFTVTELKGFRVQDLPRDSCPTPFLERLLFKITDPNHKTRHPKKGVGRV